MLEYANVDVLAGLVVEADAGGVEGFAQVTAAATHGNVGMPAPDAGDQRQHVRCRKLLVVVAVGQRCQSRDLRDGGPLHEGLLRRFRTRSMPANLGGINRAARLVQRNSEVAPI